MARSSKATSRLGYIAKFFPQDWFADNIGLTDEQFGVYMRMVFCYWSRDGLPFNPMDIAEVIGSNKVDVIELVLSKRFKRGRGKRWVHEWLDAARSEVRETALRNSAAGFAGSAIKHADEETKAGLGFKSVHTGESEKRIKPKNVAIKGVESSQPRTNNVNQNSISNSINQKPRITGEQPVGSLTEEQLARANERRLKEGKPPLTLEDAQRILSSQAPA